MAGDGGRLVAGFSRSPAPRSPPSWRDTGCLIDRAAGWRALQLLPDPDLDRLCRAPLPALRHRRDHPPDADLRRRGRRPGGAVPGGVGAERRFQTVTGQSGALAVTLSTLVAAAAFQPFASAYSGSVDRRFSRVPTTPHGRLAAFSGRLREQIDLDALNDEVLTVVTDTVRPAHASLWLRPPRPGIRRHLHETTPG